MINAAVFTGADLTGSDLTATKGLDVDFRRARLTATKFVGADLPRAKMIRTRLERSDMRGAFLFGLNAQLSDLSDSDMSGADLTNADLSGANLTRANLTDCILRGANLTGARLSDAILDGADLGQADMKGVWVELAQLDTARSLPNRLTFIGRNSEPPATALKVSEAIRPLGRLGIALTILRLGWQHASLRHPVLRFTVLILCAVILPTRIPALLVAMALSYFTSPLLNLPDTNDVFGRRSQASPFDRLTRLLFRQRRPLPSYWNYEDSYNQH